MDLGSVTWRKSSYSNGSGGACVEVADIDGGTRAVRDSKDQSEPVLMSTAAEWAVFIAGVREGEFDWRRESWPTVGRQGRRHTR